MARWRTGERAKTEPEGASDRDFRASKVRGGDEGDKKAVGTAGKVREKMVHKKTWGGK